MLSPFEPILSTETARDRKLVVFDTDQPGPVLDLFGDAFGSLGTDLDFAGADERFGSETTVALIEGGEIVATSPMEKIRKAVLLVNGDLYRTGLSGIDKHDAPDVLTELDDRVYTLRGFPTSAKEKLLLIVMSRYIERRALEAGAGRLDAAFQKLSRITDEYGTERVYRRLADSDVEVNAYGVPDVEQPADSAGIEGLDLYPGSADRFQVSWFVVFSPPTTDSDPDPDHAALLAVESESGVWRSMWTYDPERVANIRRRIDRRFR